MDASAGRATYSSKIGRTRNAHIIRPSNGHCLTGTVNTKIGRDLGFRDVYSGLANDRFGVSCGMSALRLSAPPPVKPHAGGREGLLDRLLNLVEDADGHRGDNDCSDTGQQKDSHDRSPEGIGLFGKLTSNIPAIIGGILAGRTASWIYSAGVAAR